MTSFNNEELNRVKEELNKIFNEFKSNEPSLYRNTGTNAPIDNNVFEVKEETVEQRAHRLVLLLNKVEQQLNTVGITLEKILEVGRSSNNSSMCSSAEEKIQTVKNLTLKIQTARLNLSFYFI